MTISPMPDPLDQLPFGRRIALGLQGLGTALSGGSGPAVLQARRELLERESRKRNIAGLMERMGIADDRRALLEQLPLESQAQFLIQHMNRPAPLPPLGGGGPVGGTAGTSPNRDQFIAAAMPHAMRVSQQTGIDPRVIIAQAALETGWGQSAPGNNFFGIKSHGMPGGNVLATTEVVGGIPISTSDSFRGYESMEQSFDDYGRFLMENPRYASMLASGTMAGQIDALGASGYATDPQYGQKVRMIAESLPTPGTLMGQGPQMPQTAPSAAPGATTTPGAAQPSPQSRPLEWYDNQIAGLKQRVALSREGDPLRPRYEAEIAKLERERTAAIEAAQPASFKDVGDLRKEFNSLPSVKEFDKQKSAYSRIIASVQDADAAGDLALIFNYMKLLDPGSTVREGEAASVQNAAGVPTRIKNLWNNWKEGDRLSPEQRLEFANRAETLYSAAERDYMANREQYENIAEQRGFPVDRALIDHRYTGPRVPDLDIIAPEPPPDDTPEPGDPAPDSIEAQMEYTDEERIDAIGRLNTQDLLVYNQMKEAGEPPSRLIWWLELRGELGANG